MAPIFTNPNCNTLTTVFVSKMNSHQILSIIFYSSETVSQYTQFSIFTQLLTSILRQDSVSQEYKQRPPHSSETTFISCTFQEIQYSCHGGCIYRNSGNLNIQLTTFIKCYSTASGGAFYIPAGTGNAVNLQENSFSYANCCS
jgi:hypothetical protein